MKTYYHIIPKTIIVLAFFLSGIDAQKGFATICNANISVTAITMKELNVNSSIGFTTIPYSILYTSTGYGKCTPPSAPVNTTAIANQKICYGKKTVLSASGSGTLSWYSASTGGKFLGSGSQFTTPSLTTTTTYYVQDSTCAASVTRTDIKVTVNPIYKFIDNASICDGGTYNWEGTDYSVSTKDTVKYYSIDGCDSFYILNLTVYPTYSFITNHSICEGDSFKWHGNFYSTDGTYYENNLSIHGCDSIYTLNLTVNKIFLYPDYQIICVGDTFKWQGKNYTKAGNYQANFKTIHGCDSNYSLELTVYPSYSYTESQTICEGESYYWQGVDYTTANTYKQTYTTGNGCDSTFILILKVNKSYAYTTNYSICKGDSFNWRGNYYSEAGFYYDSLQTFQGCDSLFILNLLDKGYSFNENYSICKGDIYKWHGKNYSVAGFYYDSLLTNKGCDSIYTLNLSVITIDTSLTVSGSTITANASADAYQWLDCDKAFAIINGENSQTYTPTTNGNYAVKITQGSCSDTSACVKITNVGIVSLNNEEIKIYPNPVSNVLIIEIKGNAIPHEYMIFNSVGREVIKGTVIEKSVVQTSNLGYGFYIIKLNLGNTYRYWKIVKHK